MFPGVDSGREAERLSLIRESNLWGTFNGFGAFKRVADICDEESKKV